MGLIRTNLKVRNALTQGDPIDVPSKVDTGATLLVLPGAVATRLALPLVRKQVAKYANQDTAERDVVWGVEVDVCGRKGVFDAVIEPRKTYALLGAVVMETLDLLADPASLRIYPNPRSKVPMAEIE